MDHRTKRHEAAAMLRKIADKLDDEAIPIVDVSISIDRREIDDPFITTVRIVGLPDHRRVG